MATITESTALAASPDLIPARMLNEFCYCPRLGYLEWVEREFADNLETLEGTFGHRRVDDPPGRSRREPPAAAEAGGLTEPLHARSLMLSAPLEGLIAKIDVLELDGSVATPVDYKRGKAPDLPEGAWEPERVQLCAQGLILREAGYSCDRGVIYFIGSKRRVTIEFDPALVERARELVRGFRAAAAAGQIPPPLIDSPKCPRCSLVGICLPDETNLLAGRSEAHALAGGGEPNAADDRPEAPASSPVAEVLPQIGGAAATAAAPLRKLIPADRDALPLYVQEHGAMVGKKGDRLEIRKDGATIGKVRLLDVSQLATFGNVLVTAGAMEELVDRGIPICHFSYGGYFRAMTVGMCHKNVELRIHQFAAAADPPSALAFAKSLIVGKIKNQRTLLRRNLDADPDHILDRLSEQATRAERAAAAESLLGIEGTAARYYFAGYARLFKEDRGFDFDGRNRRPPLDPINAMLSFAYAILLKDLTITLQSVGFDPMLGFFHRPKYGKPALALDLAEEFRPLIADSIVLTAANTGEISEGDFVRRAGACSLSPAGRKSLLGAYERRLSTEVTHPLFGYKITYRRAFEIQARLLGRALLGEIPHYPPFTTR